MAEQIVQTLGFDASGAIATINQLNTSLASLGTQLNNVAQGARAFNQAKIARTFKNLNTANPAKTLNSAAQAASSLGQNLNSVANQGGQSLNNLKRQTESLTISWQTLSRIIVAQTIVRGLNAISGSIRDAIRETRELQKRVGEIQTISGGQLGTDADIAAGLQVTAETFGFDILDVAEAKYQELSNQVENSTKTIEFQEAAAKLARATNSSLTDSVNLLSSALNAFGKDATQSNEVAGVLFKTIEQGRIRASELANTLGRVAPLANALGVDFNELGGALARITQGGTRADTAITQVLGILNKLSKPTEALSAAFRELGVSTALEGIQQSGGLLRFLQRLQEVAGDNATLVDFFNNVRAIQGVLSLLGTDGEKTADVFEALGISAEESAAILEKAFGEATANDAVTYEQLIQELSSTFRDFATQVIPLINDALEFLNSTFDKIRDNPVLTGTILATAAGTLLGVGTAATIASGGMAAFAASAAASVVALGPAVLIFGAVAAAVVGLNAALQAADAQAYAPLIERAKEVVADFEERVKESEKALKDQAASFRTSSQAAATFGQQFTDLRKDALSAVTELNREFTTSAEAALDSVLKSRREITKEIANAISQAEQQLERSADQIADRQAAKDDFLLQRRLNNLNELQQSYELFNASQSQAFSARDLIQGSTDLDDFDRAADVLDRRLELAQQGLQAAQASGNAAAIARAEQQVVTALNDQINLEKQRSQIIEQRKAAAEAAAAEDAAQTNRLKDLVQEIKGQLDILNNDGAILNDQQLAAQEERVKGLLDELREFGLDSDQVDLTEFLGVQDLASQFSNDLDRAVSGISARRGEIVGEVQQIYSDLNALVDDNVIEIAVELGLADGGVDQISDLISAFANGTKEIDNLTGAQQRYNEAQEKVRANAELLTRLFEGTTGPQDFLTKLNNGISEIANNPDLDPELIRQFFNALEDVVGTDIFNRIDLGGEAGDTQVLQEAVNIYKQLAEARQNAATVGAETEGDRTRLQQLQEFQRQADENIQRVQGIIDIIGAASNATGQIGAEALKNVSQIDSNKTAWDGVKSAADQAKAAVDAYSKAVREAPPPPSGGGGTNSMFGGPRGFLFRAAGGFARGTDTIPAMLSPGEFVMNARSSKRFASQLIAMNAGVNPVYRQEGGPVVNNTVNVGDINVNGTADPDDTARRVVSQLRREFRRGTASRFN